jgi:hypothetical protein
MTIPDTGGVDSIPVNGGSPLIAVQGWWSKQYRPGQTSKGHLAECVLSQEVAAGDTHRPNVENIF